MFILLFIIIYLSASLYSYLFLPFIVITYLWAHVFIDSKIKMYPYRILMFAKHVIPDTVRLYHAIRGSFKYRSLFI